MTEEERKEILSKAKLFFKDTIARRHIENTKKLRKLSAFDINPFLKLYLPNFLTGNNSPESIARALVYPRALGTSINTSFGTNIQYFCSNVLEGFGSGIPGIDIEFYDQLDGKKKYCQVKAGTNTINADDVETISGHFKDIRNLARTNRLEIGINDLIVGVFYGTHDKLSGHYLRVNESYPVIVGQDFWHRLTGSSNFYSELIDAIGEVAIETDGSQLLEQVISDLAKEIEEKGI